MERPALSTRPLLAPRAMYPGRIEVLCGAEEGATFGVSAVGGVEGVELAEEEGRISF